MPLYEYACPSCEHTFEELVMGDETVACPKCESTKVEKLLSVPGLAKTLSTTSCGDPSLPPCGAPWCQRGRP